MGVGKLRGGSLLNPLNFPKPSSTFLNPSQPSPTHGDELERRRLTAYFRLLKTILLLTRG